MLNLAVVVQGRRRAGFYIRPCGGPSTACLACRSRAKAARYAPIPRPLARFALAQYFTLPSPPASPSRDATRQGGLSTGFYGLWHLTTAIERTWVRNLPTPDTHHRSTLGATRQERLEGTGRSSKSTVRVTSSRCRGWRSPPSA